MTSEQSVGKRAPKNKAVREETLGQLQRWVCCLAGGRKHPSSLEPLLEWLGTVRVREKSEWSGPVQGKHLHHWDICVLTEIRSQPGSPLALPLEGGQKGQRNLLLQHDLSGAGRAKNPLAVRA